MKIVLKHDFYKTEIFAERIAELDAWKDYDGLKRVLDQAPEAGDVIPGGDGLRKIRMTLSKKGAGKRGGARVIYYQVSKEGFVLMVYAYAKSEVENLTRDELKELTGLRDDYLELIRKKRNDAAKRTQGTKGRATGRSRRPGSTDS